MTTLNTLESTQALSEQKLNGSLISALKTPKKLTLSLLSSLALYRERAYQRRALARLSQRQLDDMGISQQARAKEMAKKCWQR